MEALQNVYKSRGCTNCYTSITDSGLARTESGVLVLCLYETTRPGTGPWLAETVQSENRVISAQKVKGTREHDFTEKHDCQNGPVQDRNNYQGMGPAWQRQFKEDH